MTTIVLSDAERRAMLVLDALKRHRRMSDAQIAAAGGFGSHRAIHTRRTGITKISLGDLDPLASALGVEPSVFFLEPDDAIRWVLDHSPNQREAGYVTLALTAAVVGVAALTRVPPEVAAGIAQAIAENGCDDDVMSGDVEITLPLAA